MTDWVEIETKCSVGGYFNKKVWESVDDFFGWIVVIHRITYQDADSENCVPWHFESPCVCLGDSWYRSGEEDIPETKDSVTIICNVCEEKTARFSGLVTGKLRMWVSKEIHKNG